MKLNFTFCWLVLFVAPLGLSQEELTTHFPDDFFGIYTGILQISSPNGNRSIAMEFHLQPTDTLGQYQYKLFYGKGDEKQERPYALKEKNKDLGEYMVDENNGIILDEKVINNRMYTLFEVGGNLLTTFITFEENQMIFEIVFAPKAKKNITHTNDEAKTEVISYPITTVQRAILKKQ